MNARWSGAWSAAIAVVLMALAATPTQANDSDPLAVMLGAEPAAKIRTALDDCLAEYRAIAAEIESDGGDAEEITEVIALGEEDCATAQARDVQIVLLDRQIAAERARQAELRAERAAIEADAARISDQTAELKIINDELGALLIGRAICEAQGGTPARCDADRARMDDLFRRARALTRSSTN